MIVPALSDEAKACLKALIASVKSLQSRLGRSLDGMVKSGKILIAGLLPPVRDVDNKFSSMLKGHCH